MKKTTLFLFAIVIIMMPLVMHASTSSVAERLHGYILLQVEEHGEAWFIRSEDSKRYYMSDGDAAYSMMREFSLGITDTDLAKIPSVSDTSEMLELESVCESNSLANRLKGEILLQVEQHGEAWYVYPDTCRMIYMEDGSEAYTIMRYLGLGITNSDLEDIETGELEGYATVEETTDTSDDSSNTSEELDWPSDIGTSHFGRLTELDRIESDLEGGWVRPHSGPFVWGWIEEDEGVYDWDQADEVVESHQESRQAILATIWGFANWDQENCHSSSDKAQASFLHGIDWLHAPCDESAYLNWLTALVERYDGDGTDDMPGLEYPVRHWEIFNEPSFDEDPTFFQDDADVYADILITSHETIKAADENAVVLSGGQAGMGGDTENYWDEVLDLISGSFDFGNIHSISSDDVFWTDEYRLFLDDHGFEEIGYWVTEALVGDMMEDLSSAELAQLTFTGYVSAFANGADVIFNVGYHDPTGGPGEDSEEVFEFLAENLGEFSSVAWESSSAVLFSMSDGSSVVALWDNATLDEVDEISIQGEVEVLKYTGDSFDMDANDVIADVPILVLYE